MPRSPEFYPSRSGSTVTLSLINPNTTDFTDIIIRRAEERSKNFISLGQVAIANFPHNDTIPDTSKRYKYKLAYADPLSKEVINTSTEVINTSAEYLYKPEEGVRSVSKFTDK